MSRFVGEIACYAYKGSDFTSGSLYSAFRRRTARVSQGLTLRARRGSSPSYEPGRSEAKIIGHRGAAGLALENSSESLRAAVRHGVDVIEFDVRLTKDGQLVVIHDKTTRRLARRRLQVRSCTLSQLQSLPLKDGHKILSLSEALELTKGTPVIIDIKDYGVAAHIQPVLRQFPDMDISFASFKHTELAEIRKQDPQARIYVLDHFKPLEIIQKARHLRATGIGLNMWLMNPLTYRLARRYGLEIFVYVINGPLIRRFYHKLYPGADICTDHPERFT